MTLQSVVAGLHGPRRDNSRVARSRAKPQLYVNPAGFQIDGKKPEKSFKQVIANHRPQCRGE